VFSGAHALNRLLRMDLRGRGQDDGFQAGSRQGFLETRCPVRDPVLLGNGLRGFGGPSIKADHLGIFDPFKPVEVLFSERTLPHHANLHLALLEGLILERKSAKRGRKLV